MATTTIYIRLLDEGTTVYRPTGAEELGDGIYRVLATPDYDTEDETWEFPPGTLVRCTTLLLTGDQGDVPCMVATDEVTMTS